MVRRVHDLSVKELETSEGRKMSILGWIVLGLIAGYIASKIVESRGQGFFINILLGIIGGMVGGWLFERFGGTGVQSLEHVRRRDGRDRRAGRLSSHTT